MKDRLGAVGGRLDVSTEPGRTRVLGTIPLAR
jgi:signal transduction histidine kinase